MQGSERRELTFFIPLAFSSSLKLFLCEGDDLGKEDDGGPFVEVAGR
jgi:hypothetical protein